MGELTIIDRLRGFVGKVAFAMFLWAIEMTEEQYWSSVYTLESMRRSSEQDEAEYNARNEAEYHAEEI